MQLIWNLSIEEMMGVQSRSYPHGIPKVSTFTYCNKLTSRIVSKPLLGLTTLNQALICTPTPNLISQKVTYLFCDELDIVSKELRSRVRQATKDVVKSEV